MEQFVRGVEAILQSNPGMQAERESLLAWYVIVSDMPYDLFAAAVFDVCRNEKKPPFGVNLGAMLRERAHALETSSCPPAEEAWGEVLDQVRRRGAYGSPSFRSSVTAEAVKRIGWREICGAKEGDPALRAHFYRTYDKETQARAGRLARTVGSETEAAAFLDRLALGEGLPALQERSGKILRLPKGRVEG